MQDSTSNNVERLPRSQEDQDPEAFILSLHPDLDGVIPGTPQVWQYCTKVASRIEKRVENLNDVIERSLELLNPSKGLFKSVWAKYFGPVARDLSEVSGILQSSVADYPPHLLLMNASDLAMFSRVDKMTFEFFNAGERMRRTDGNEDQLLNYFDSKGNPVPYRAPGKDIFNWCAQRPKVESQIRLVIDRLRRLKNGYLDLAEYKSKSKELKARLSRAKSDIERHSAKVEQANRELQRKDEKISSMGQEIAYLKIEAEDLKMQRDNCLRLVNHVRGGDSDTASESRIHDEGSANIASRPSHSTTAAAASIGPNGSLHIPIAQSVAGSISTTAQKAGQQGISAFKIFIKKIPHTTCYKLILAATLLLILYTALAIVYSKGGDDLGGGFALGSYLVTATALVASAVAAFHYPHCQCWRKTRTQNGISQSLPNGVRMRERDLAR